MFDWVLTTSLKNVFLRDLIFDQGFFYKAVYKTLMLNHSLSKNQEEKIQLIT